MIDLPVILAFAKKQEARCRSAMWGQLVGSLGTFDLQLPVTRIGRVNAKADIVIPKAWISGLQCIIELHDDKTAWLKDMSTNGVYINGTIVGKSVEREIHENDEISFTKPQLNTPNIEPTFFHFRFVHQESFTTPTKGKRSVPTPEPKTVIDSAKKLCVSSTSQRDELVSGAEAMQKANQELRQRLVDAGNRESDLRAQLQSMLATVQEKQEENDKLREDITKTREKALEANHQRQEYEALEEKYKQLDAKCIEIDMNLTKEVELHKQCQAELEATQRNIGHQNHVVTLLKEELEESLSKTAQATQKVRQLEAENQKLQHQLDSVNRASDHEQESTRGAKEEVLVMKARFATAREAFHQMYTHMLALGEQIEVQQAVADEEDDGSQETQCVLTERYAKVTKDEEDSPVKDADLEDEDAQNTTALTEPTTLQVDETMASSPTVYIAETNKRWLQLKEDTSVASVDDCGGIFEESQDQRH
ncbi:unnamed protein product [Aphanomyces euteiches]|nr:hypothetical protein AeRB84_011267 [Aphanomyces euteiches]